MATYYERFGDGGMLEKAGVSGSGEVDSIQLNGPNWKPMTCKMQRIIRHSFLRRTIRWETRGLDGGDISTREVTTWVWQRRKRKKESSRLQTELLDELKVYLMMGAI